MHSGMYDMYAMQQSFRSMRGAAVAEVKARELVFANKSAACSRAQRNRTILEC